MGPVGDDPDAAGVDAERPDAGDEALVDDADEGGPAQGVPLGGGGDGGGPAAAPDAALRRRRAHEVLDDGYVGDAVPAGDTGPEDAAGEARHLGDHGVGAAGRRGEEAGREDAGLERRALQSGLTGRHVVPASVHADAAAYLDRPPDAPVLFLHLPGGIVGQTGQRPDAGAGRGPVLGELGRVRTYAGQFRRVVGRHHQKPAASERTGP